MRFRDTFEGRGFTICTDEFVPAFHPAGVHHARGHGVRPNTGRLAYSQGFGERNQRRLGRAICNGTALPAGARDGRHVDDLSPRFGHFGYGCPGAVEGALDVDVEDRIPRFIGKGLEIGQRHEDGGTRVVDQDVQSTQFLGHAVHHFKNGTFHRDVCADGDRISTQVVNIGNRGLRFESGPRVIDRHVGPFRGEEQGGRPANSRAAAGHKRDLSV